MLHCIALGPSFEMPCRQPSAPEERLALAGDMAEAEAEVGAALLQALIVPLRGLRKGRLQPPAHAAALQPSRIRWTQGAGALAVSGLHCVLMARCFAASSLAAACDLRAEAECQYQESQSYC